MRYHALQHILNVLKKKKTTKNVVEQIGTQTKLSSCLFFWLRASFLLLQKLMRLSRGIICDVLRRVLQRLTSSSFEKEKKKSKWTIFSAHIISVQLEHWEWIPPSTSFSLQYSRGAGAPDPFNIQKSAAVCLQTLPCLPSVRLSLTNLFIC